jgi:hypothetical protein
MSDRIMLGGLDLIPLGPGLGPELGVWFAGLDIRTFRFYGKTQPMECRGDQSSRLELHTAVANSEGGNQALGLRSLVSPYPPAVSIRNNTAKTI